MGTIKYCDVCGLAGATYPSVLKPGTFLCADPYACIKRFEEMPPEAQERNFARLPAVPRER